MPSLIWHTSTAHHLCCSAAHQAEQAEPLFGGTNAHIGAGMALIPEDVQGMQGVFIHQEVPVRQFQINLNLDQAGHIQRGETWHAQAYQCSP